MQQATVERAEYKPKNQTSRTKMMAVRLPLDLIREMKELARRNERTMTAELARAVRAHIVHNQ
jgi:predicted DNA-binding protein